jgi:hypothetical protein
MVARFEERATHAERNSETLRNFLVDLSSPDTEMDSMTDTD